MTDRQRLLVALLSESENATRVADARSALDLMAILSYFGDTRALAARS